MSQDEKRRLITRWSAWIAIVLWWLLFFYAMASGVSNDPLFVKLRIGAAVISSLAISIGILKMLPAIFPKKTEVAEKNK